MATLSAVVVCHNGSPSHILGNLVYQSRKADEILVFWSEPDMAEWEFCVGAFPQVDMWAQCEDRNDWGHEKRSMGLAAAEKDYVGFFNHDDSYSPLYVEKMMAAADAGFPIVYCGWNVYPDCHYSAGSSTSGNFVISVELARQAGYEGRDYSADAQFITATRELAEANGDSPVKIPDILYYWNEIR